MIYDPLCFSLGMLTGAAIVAVSFGLSVYRQLRAGDKE